MGRCKRLHIQIRYIHKDGDVFKEIDNSLVPEGNDKYKNTDSPFGVSVSKNFKNKNLITLSSDNHELSWSYMKKKYKIYLEALDRDVKKENKNPSVGLVLCAGEDDAVVEYSLSRSFSPVLIADYKLHLPNKEMLENRLREIAESSDSTEIEK